MGDKAKAKDALDKALNQFERAPFVKRQLLALGGELGLADAKEAGGSETASAPRGPTAEQMRDALNMSAEDRQEMIEGMVAGLAAKLEENPNDLQGWIRLARSTMFFRSRRRPATPCRVPPRSRRRMSIF